MFPKETSVSQEDQCLPRRPVSPNETCVSLGDQCLLRRPVYPWEISVSLGDLCLLGRSVPLNETYVPSENRRFLRRQTSP